MGASPSHMIIITIHTHLVRGSWLPVSQRVTWAEGLQSSDWETIASYYIWWTSNLHGQICKLLSYLATDNSLWTFLSSFRDSAGDKLLYIWKFFCAHKNILPWKLLISCYCGWFWNIRRKLALNSLATVKSTFKISASLSFPMEKWHSTVQKFAYLIYLELSHKIVINPKFTDSIDDSIDNTFGSLPFNMCDAVSTHPQPATKVYNHKNPFPSILHNLCTIWMPRA